MTDTKQNQPDAPEAGMAGGPADATGPAPEHTFTPEMLTELVARAAKAEENWERYVRATAELDNLKKRFVREKQDAMRYANEELLERLIPVLDNFDMAVAAVSNPQANSVESIRVGINMILTQLKGTITEAGLEEIDARGQAFNPNFHEAVSQQESADTPEGQVLQQMRKGYKLRDRLLRPASVVVSKKPGA
jgi:molecular chaperone GrpE